MGKASKMELIAPLLLSLPFLLFAPLAGWLSDRFSKRNVLVACALTQLIILAGLSGAIAMKSFELAMAGFFALAVLTAFFNPAKTGVVKELVGSRHLGFASSIQQMTGMLAILAGQILAGLAFDHRLNESNDGWQAAHGPLWVITALALPPLLLSLMIPRTPRGEAERLSPKLAFQHFHQMKDLWRNPALRRSSVGIAFFVGFAPPMAPEDADIESIRRGMMEASAMALAARASDPAQANALQLAHVNALQRGDDFGTLDSDPLPGSLPGLAIFEKQFGAIRRDSPYPDASSEDHWLGGNVLRERIEASKLQPGGVFFDFSDRATEPLAHTGWQHCPCLAIGGVIIAMSMPQPPKAHPGSKEQFGHKPGSHGILLPGFWLDGAVLRGPSVPDGLPLPEGTTVDEEGFVFLPGRP